MQKADYSSSFVWEFLQRSLSLDKAIPFLVQPISQEVLLWKEKNIAFIPICKKFSLEKIEACKTVLHQMHIVWLLDDRVFHKKRLSETEKHLRSLSCYFFHVSTENLEIYDQKELVTKNSRSWLSNPLTVDLCSPYFENNYLRFKGDYQDRIKRSPSFKKAMDPSPIWDKRLNKKLFYSLLSFSYKRLVEKLHR